MNEEMDPSVFVTTPEQQRVLGLPETEAAYSPQQFVDLLGRAQMVHFIMDQSAQTGPREKRVDYRTQAGLAQSVAVGVLRKVTELGATYDQAVQQPESFYDQPADEALLVPEVFTNKLQDHYTEAAKRRIAEVREYQNQLAWQDQMIANGQTIQQS